MKIKLFQKSLIRFSFVFLLCIFWYLTKNSSLEYILTYPVFICGILFLAIAWFDYLNLDGMEINRLSFARYSNQLVNKIGNDHVTQTTRNASTSDEVIAFYSNLIVGVILLLPSIILAIIS